ncbi:MAG: preprotein translocase subunit SecY [Candidatus Aenigmarchaeota archaeon]|nr:preprotein translocase subunit SecY [Candidatus Aenigmarchaeota archaeon]
MGFSDTYLQVINRLPSVSRPIEKQSLKKRLKWTALILILYLAMAQITVYGVDQVRIQSVGIFELLLGAKFGSIMSLGIGPIVTASIILQLLVGSGILPWNIREEKGKILFQGTQKILGIVLSFVEASVFVAFGAVPAASPGLVWLVIAQMGFGGILVIYMDELISKWGFGSGISLFIVAGVSSQIVTSSINPFANCPTELKAISPCSATPDNPPVGRIPQAFFFVGLGEPLQAFIALLPVMATVLVFLLVVYANAIKVEIPLAFGSIRGFGRRWPLKFFYTSNIPVILVAALLANMQLFGRILNQRGITLFGTVDENGFATSGLLYFLTPPQIGGGSGLGISVLLIVLGIFALAGALVAHLTKKPPLKVMLAFVGLGLLVWIFLIPLTALAGLVGIRPPEVLRILTYSAVLVGGSIIFAVFWVSTAGMDSRSVAEQIHSTGMQIPGFRRDIRIIEGVLERYIPPLTVLGAAAVGLLAAYADFTGALGTGTGILLAALIVHQLYEELAAQQLEEMHPAIRKFLGQ